MQHNPHIGAAITPMRMKKLTDMLGRYAEYHCDRRNIATHFAGIPMIVLALAILLARPTADWAGLPWSPAVVAAAVATLYYLRLDLRYGTVMGLLLVVSVLAGQPVAALSTPAWLGSWLGLFAGGWALQFLGHWYEGRRPAFVDDVMGLIVGPLFVVAEIGFTLGLRPEVQAVVEARSGTVRETIAAGAPVGSARPEPR